MAAAQTCWPKGLETAQGDWHSARQSREDPVRGQQEPDSLPGAASGVGGGERVPGRLGDKVA